MSAATAGSRLGYTGKEAKTKGEELLNNFFTGFPKVKEAIDQSKAFLRKYGYVEDFIGRRRRLDDVYLPKYEVFLKDADEASNFNPFLECENRVVYDPRIAKWQQEVNSNIVASQRYQAKKAQEAGNTWEENGEMSNAKYEDIKKKAAKDGVVIKANTGRIAKAERQCFNARIQGSSASLTKIAMIDIFNNEQLKKYDAHLIITVHDEVLVECPAVYADKVEKLLPEIMVNAAKEVGDDVPQACDPYNVDRWYADVWAATILEHYKKLESKYSRDEALEKICEEFEEFPKQSILDVISGKTSDLVF